MTTIEALQEQIKKLTMENEKLTKQTQDLWELCSLGDGVIEPLIELRGEEYVKKVFDEDYTSWKEVQEEYEEGGCNECQAIEGGQIEGCDACKIFHFHKGCWWKED